MRTGVELREHRGMNIRESMARHGWVRPRTGRVVAGVCAGIGRRVGLGPWTTRLLFVLAMVVLPGSPLVAYLALWILMPAQD